jgi:pyruvate formate lyase activating enzyme
MSAQDLYDKVKIDQLYFLSTGGGVTFGGGEPLLYPRFLKEFREICGQAWHLCAETSLNVPWENVEAAAECIDKFYIDCKDTNPEIYRRYTGRDNEQTLSNLQKLVSLIGPERIVIRMPLIPEFNTDEDRQKSKALLEEMGVTQFNFFNYIIKH